LASVTFQHDDVDRLVLALDANAMSEATSFHKFFFEVKASTGIVQFSTYYANAPIF
jgi:hypothetical protein